MNKKIGSINPCNCLGLYNNLNQHIGECLDTPNAFAFACAINPNVFKGVAHYQFFGNTYRYANEDDIIDRINYYKKSINNNIDNLKNNFLIKFYEY